MHQYKIVIYRYTAEGAVGEYISTVYADDAEKVKLTLRQYDGYQADEEGNPTANKLYKREVYTLGYNLVDPDELFRLHRV